MADDILISDLRGGRNGIDSPLVLPQTQCAEAVNVDWEEGQLATKRRGSVNIQTDADLSAGVASMFRHVPLGEEVEAEGWFVLEDNTIVRLTTAGWSTVTMDDAMTGEAFNVEFCTFNGKLFIAYQSAVDRLHVYDPHNGKVRRVGLAAPGAAPTAANTGSGSVTGTRFIRVRFIDYVSGVVRRRSEPSASVSFTPSGSGSAVRVTRPTLIGEGETHWEVEVALSADGPWYVRFGVDNGDTAIVVGTTTADDTTDANAANYADLPTSETVGEFSLPGACRYLMTDGNNLLMAGSYKLQNTSRIWNTPALGSADHGDDERIILTDTIKGYIDLNEKDGGKITGLAPPVNGYPLAFKYRQTWRLSPTGDPNSIYIPRRVSGTVGCIFSKTIVLCEDASGNAQAAWLSARGPWRMSLTSGLVKFGRDVDDIWLGLNGQPAPINLQAGFTVAHAIYHADRHQIWFFIAIGEDHSPSIKLMVDLRRNVVVDEYGVRGGWALHQGKSCQAVCSMMFSQTYGARMSLNLKPWVAYRDPTAS